MDGSTGAAQRIAMTANTAIPTFSGGWVTILLPISVSWV
jgi:hypothetical protein